MIGKAWLRQIAVEFPTVQGLVTYIPGATRLAEKWVGTGGTISARYCYSVWLRHLQMAHHRGLSTHPLHVAELGPGDSLGIGLAALLSGAEHYYGFDIVRFAPHGRNVAIFEELVDLFRNRASIPDKTEFPNIEPTLDSHAFPEAILTPERLSRALHPQRIDAIRRALNNQGIEHDGIRISYVVPWNDPQVLREGSMDMIFSQATLEHVDDLDHTYDALHRWLKPEGFMSHEIDFKCHVTSSQWNGHWGYSDQKWQWIKGKRSYLLNRQPYSTHVKLMLDKGFKIVHQVKHRAGEGIARDRLASRFRDLSEEDLMTSGLFVQARKT